MITLIFGENRDKILGRLQATLGAEQGVKIVQEPLQDFTMRPDIDGLIVTGQFAHERIGGRSQPGVSQILETASAPLLPPSFEIQRVVTTPSFPGHLEISKRGKVAVVPNEPNLTAQEEVYRIFSTVLQAVEGFNGVSERISVLGCYLDLIDLPISQDEKGQQEELQAIVRAYHEHLKRIGQ